MKHFLLKPIIVLAGIIGFQYSYAQEDPTIIFQGSQLKMDVNSSEVNFKNWPQQSLVDNNIVGYVRFTTTPSQQTKDRLEKEGVTLLEYFGNQTYLFSSCSSLASNKMIASNAVSIKPLDKQLKSSYNLKNHLVSDWATDGTNYKLLVELFKPLNDVITYNLKGIGAQINNSYTNEQIIEIVIPSNNLDLLAELPAVKYVEEIPAPSIKEDFDGRGLHRSNNLDTQIAGGRNYTGDGIGILVRDDGIVGPHIDFKGRIDNSKATGTGQTHGDGVAGILAGAGNLNPRNRGMAVNADIYVTNYNSTFLDTATLDLINNGQVQITNNSYGNGCNGGYSLITERLDNQVNTNPSILHVFSAGNVGNGDCGYGVPGWGNITGGHKQGKNVIATANIYEDGTLASTSSRGPATDGRIKPDITAHGQGQISTNENNTYHSFGGTSGAAPGIAGVAAQLYEVHKDKFNTLPESGLIKAVMLNTASDYGNVGPDFKYGWGLVNGLQAAKTLENDYFYKNTITHNNSQNNTINIPANTKELRVMLYWTDAPAKAGASKALVNDLDLSIVAPDNSVHLPWVLDPTPSATALNAPATRGKDRLNNMEQVVINNPTAGSYNINVEGFDIPVGPQSYYVVYEFINDAITLTYPYGGENFTPGQQEIIQWDAIAGNQDFTVEYSTDNGGTWNLIDTVDSDKRLLEWAVPNSYSGNCKVRVSTASASSSSSELFSIAPKVQNLTIERVCPNFIKSTWTEIPEASSYEIFLLGEKFMELVGTTTTTSYNIPIPNAEEEQWIAVRATGGNGWIGIRSNAIKHDGNGVVNCSLSDDLSVTTILNEASEFEKICDNSPIIVRTIIENLGVSAQSNFEITYEFGNNKPVTEIFTGTLPSGETLFYEFNSPIAVSKNGLETLMVSVDLSNDEEPSNDLEFMEVYVQVNGEPLSIEENFEVDFESDTLLPEGWSISNSNEEVTWEEANNIIGSNGELTAAIYHNGSQDSDRGSTDAFTTVYYDLNFDGDATLSFDLAKAQWASIYNDELRVLISTDCGEHYNVIYSKDGNELATVPNTDSRWIPDSAANWRTESIDLSSYKGNNVKLRFELINDFSNSTFIDNIKLEKSGNENSPSISGFNAQISMFPNPATDVVNLDIPLTSNDSIAEVNIINSLGQQVAIHELSNAQTSIDTSNYSSGVYFLQISNNKNQAVKRLIVE